MPGMPGVPGIRGAKVGGTRTPVCGVTVLQSMNYDVQICKAHPGQHCKHRIVQTSRAYILKIERQSSQDATDKRGLGCRVWAPVFCGDLREQTGENGFPRIPTGSLFCSTERNLRKSPETSGSSVALKWVS